MFSPIAGLWGGAKETSGPDADELHDVSFYSLDLHIPPISSHDYSLEFELLYGHPRALLRGVEALGEIEGR